MADSGLVLYADMVSQPCRAVVAFLQLTHIPFELRIMSIRNNEHKTLKNNTLGTLPYIEEKGFGLSESHAIFAYLLSTRRCAEHWLPPDPVGYSLCQMYLHWHHSGLRHIGRFLFWSFGARKMGIVGIPGIVEDHWKQGHQALHVLNRWLEQRPYLAGPQVSIADLSAVCELAQLQLVPDLFSRTLAEVPNVAQWFARVYNIPEVKAAHSLLESLSAKRRSRL